MRLLAIVAVALALGPVAAARQSSTHTVFHVGDSLAEGTALFLKGYLGGWVVRQEVKVSMQSEDVPRRVRARGSALPHVVVVSAGTNGSPSAVAMFSEHVRATIRAAGAGRCVIWATVVRPPYMGVSYAALNRELRALDRRYETLRVLDWAAMVRAHPGWVSRDGVHASMEAYRARARATAALVKACEA